MINHSDKRKAFYGFLIPNEWRLEKLRIFGETYTGLSGKTKEDFGVGKPYIPYLNIFNNAIISDGDFDYVKIEIEENQYIVQNGDLFFTTSSETPEEVGMCSVYLGNESELYLNSFCFGFRAYNKTEVSTEYLAQLFRSSLGRRIIYKLAQGATRYNISKTNLLNEEIPLPPLPEQKAIAQVLSTADAAIHTTEKLIAQKELRKKWLMQQLLTGKKRLKGFGGEWKEMHLGEMFIERNETKYFDLPLLSIGQNGVYPQDESVKKDTSNDDKSKYKRICSGDIGYNTMRMWQGRSALSELEGIVSPAYTVVTPKKNADSVFFSYLFKTPKMTNLFWRNSQGLVDDTLNCKFKDFSIVKVMLPQAKEEQTAIAQVLQATDKEISLLKAKAAKLREQKKGLMQQLLSGKKRIKV